MFEEQQYPEYAAHKQEHDALTRQVAELQKKFREGNATIPFEVLDFLRD